LARLGDVPSALTRARACFTCRRRS
jgi:hypothetical protein